MEHPQAMLWIHASSDWSMRAHRSGRHRQISGGKLSGKLHMECKKLGVALHPQARHKPSNLV